MYLTANTHSAMKRKTVSATTGQVNFLFTLFALLTPRMNYKDTGLTQVEENGF